MSTNGCIFKVLLRSRLYGLNYCNTLETPAPATLPHAPPPLDKNSDRSESRTWGRSAQLFAEGYAGLYSCLRGWGCWNAIMYKYIKLLWSFMMVLQWNRWSRRLNASLQKQLSLWVSVWTAVSVPYSFFWGFKNEETRRWPPRRLKGSGPEGGAVSLRAVFNFVSAWRGASCPTGWNNTARRAARERKSVSAPWERNVRDKKKTQEEPQSGGGAGSSGFFSISMQRRGESEAATRPASKCRKWKL